MFARKTGADFRDQTLAVGARADLQREVLEFEHNPGRLAVDEGLSPAKVAGPMKPPIARRAASLGRFRRVAITTGAILLILIVGGYLGGKAWVAGYLRSDAFRQFVAAKLGETLRAEANVSPFSFNGLTFYSDGLEARGFEDASFASAQLGQVRAELSLRRFFEKVWQIEQLEVQRLTVRLAGTRLARPPRTRIPEEARQRSTLAGWLPNRVEVGGAVLQEFNVEWGDLPSSAGALRGMQLRAAPAGQGWDLTGQGGQLVSVGFPPLEAGTVKMHQREQSLLINSAEFRQGAIGRMDATGEIHFGERVDLRVQLAGIDLTPFLQGDWRARVHGKAAGEVRVQSPLPAINPPLLSGSLRLEEGYLEALPVLEQIDRFTGSHDFRRITLTRASGDFVRDLTQLRVTNFVAESQGLLRLEGSFTISAGELDGTFQVGVAPSRLQWLPGSQGRVFTETRGGYVWTPMRLTGPVNAPKEDLSPRLLAAAKDAAVEKVETTARDAVRTGKDAAKSALDFVLPLFK